MGWQTEYVLQNATTQVSGSAQVEASAKAVTIEITGTATVELYVSLDGDSWVLIGTYTTSKAFEEAFKGYPYIKAAITSISSGKVTVLVGQEIE